MKCNRLCFHIIWNIYVCRNFWVFCSVLCTLFFYDLFFVFITPLFMPRSFSPTVTGQSLVFRKKWMFFKKIGILTDSSSITTVMTSSPTTGTCCTYTSPAWPSSSAWSWHLSHCSYWTLPNQPSSTGCLHPATPVTTNEWWPLVWHCMTYMRSVYVKKNIFLMPIYWY